MLTSVAEQAGLSLTWSETPEDTFCMTKLIYDTFETGCTGKNEEKTVKFS